MTTSPEARAHGASTDPTSAPTSRLSVAELVRERAWSIGLCFGMVAWSIALFAIARHYFVDFQLARYDLGNMVQAVWSTAHGRPLEISDSWTGDQVSRLAYHVDPILAALAPIWVIAPSPLTLVAIQVVAVASGALPLYWLARRHLASERAAGLLSIAYLVYPWTGWTAIDAFHPVTLAIPLFLFAIWFLDGDRLVAFAVCAALAATTGEMIGLSVGALGVWYALARGRRRAGLVIAIAGTAWTVIALRVIVPAFSGGESVFYGAYQSVGGSPEGIVKTLFTHPGTIVSTLTRGSDVLYLFLLVLPVAAAFLLAPGLAAVATPALAANLLSSLPGTTDPHAHYIAGILPFLFGAIAVGLGRVSAEARLRVVVLVVTLSAAASIVVGPWPFAIGGTPDFYATDTATRHVRALERAVALVPDGVPVSSTNRIGSHLAERRYAYVVPTLSRAQWIVVDRSDPWIPASFGGAPDPAKLSAFETRIERSPDWRNVFDEDGVLVFRKVAG